MIYVFVVREELRNVTIQCIVSGHKRKKIIF